MVFMIVVVVRVVIVIVAVVVVVVVMVILIIVLMTLLLSGIVVVEMRSSSLRSQPPEVLSVLGQKKNKGLELLGVLKNTGDRVYVGWHRNLLSWEPVIYSVRLSIIIVEEASRNSQRRARRNEDFWFLGASSISRHLVLIFVLFQKVAGEDSHDSGTCKKVKGMTALILENSRKGLWSDLVYYEKMKLVCRFPRKGDGMDESEHAVLMSVVELTRLNSISLPQISSTHQTWRREPAALGAGLGIASGVGVYAWRIVKN
ncbi:uncharacterized protein BDR25DRAFT_350264 [Lindgomyces ingoldianus]|uniref:Uncharacterized protein n=1 Tax=Lindgomyces ingoldianus TaxID=673940 RepID=A0ACB6RCC5_9PLEO|nr:uncharacterized protein BDR25DRAFT_350264 [Lindgomyces ingoldianus]KAF2475985.1 hypothetical protein BDR25DRAFT_350264 [Lindgomyces ingoldianus]